MDVSSTLTAVDGPGDAELISAVRGGDVSAYGELFERHVAAARRLARQLTTPADADDLVSDAFTKVLKVLQGGGGPDVAFRAYLLTAVRRLHVDKIRAGAKLHTTDDLEPFDPGVPFRDTAVEGFENAAAAKAFASLPERWQLVLWHTEVEGQKPAEVAALLGMSANSVSALAYRAREGLRQAFLNSHAEELDEPECRWTHDHLGAYVRNGVSRRDAAKIEKHLDECRGCMAIYLELTEVNSNLGALLAPLLLGGVAGTAYLASAGSLASKGFLLVLADRVKDWVAANTQVAAVSGVAAVAGVAGIAVAVGVGIGGDEQPTSDPPQAAAPVATESTTSPPSTAPSTPRKPARSPERTENPPSRQPTTAPTTSPSTAPSSDDPSSTSSSAPTPDPTPTPTPSPEPTPTQTEGPGGENPDPPPTQPPTDPPTEPPAADLTVSGSADRLGTSVIWDVGLRVSHGPSTVRITSNNPVVVLAGYDGRCSRIAIGSITCHVEDAAAASFSMRAMKVLADTSITFTVTPDEGTEDADPGNNSTTVALAP